MTRYVVDASVAAKRYLPEEYSGEAAIVMGGEHALVAPDFLVVELAQVLLKRARRHELRLERARGALASVRRFVDLIPSLPLSRDPFELAARFDRSVYDALYLALALREECALITADRRLFEAVQPHLPEAVVWIGDFTTGDAT